jgi:Mg2+/Co2+ transporter CorB
MDPDILAAIGLVLFLLLDLITSAARSAFSNSSLARLLTQREEMISQVNRTTQLLSNTPRMQSSLNLFQSILRFLIAGLSLLLFVPWAGTSYLLPYSLGVLLLASLVTFFLEWLIETAVSHHPETWAMRLSSYARVLYLVMSPLLALPFLFISPSETNQEGGV